MFAGLRSAHLRLCSARVSQPGGRHVFPVGRHGRGLLPLPYPAREPSYCRGPGRPKALRNGLRFSDCLFWLVWWWSGERRTTSSHGVVQMVQLTRRLRFHSIHTITPVGKQCKKFQQWSWGFAARTLFFHLRGRPPSLSSQARTRSLARVPQPCVLSCSRAMRGAYHAPDRARVNPPRRARRARGSFFFAGSPRVFAARHPRSPFPPNRR